jgi:hypothetical protein
MARKKRETMWVIFARPEQRKGPGNLFVSRDGTKTESRTRAAKFYTAEAAGEFAKEKGITLDGAMRYIGQMDFSGWDLQQD